MKRNHPLLCSPIQVGNITLRNRMAAAPTGGVDILPGGGIGRRSTAFYELKAKGGASVVTVGEVIVHEETDCSPMFHLSDDTAAGGMLSTFSYTADAIRRHGAIPCLQLSHGGCFAALQLGKDKYGVSEVTDQTRLAELYPYTCGNIKEGLTQNGPLPVIRELTKQQIHDIVNAYGKTAQLAKRAGFGMIQIHCGHGWLINQFFSPAHNHRTDEYGGSIENRCRFALEVIKSVRKAVGPGFPIEVRISGKESIPGGYGLDTAVEICKILDPYVDLFHISAGSHHIDYKVTHTSPFMLYGCNVEMAARIKKNVTKPVAVVGNLFDPDMMEDIIATGKADIIYTARANLADSYWPRKVMENRADEIVHCLRCYNCSAERSVTRTRRCSLNPMIGREIDGMEITPAAVSRRVMVVGGAPGGLEAALVCAQRGHKTILCEKASRLGGVLNCEEGNDWKKPMFEYPKTMHRLLERNGVDIRLNTTVTPEYVESEKVDVLICAIGGEPIIPPIPGIEGENVISVQEIPQHMFEIGQKVAVLGGGLAGTEAALQLGRDGKDVTIIEMKDAIMPDGNRYYRLIILEELGKCVDVKVNSLCTKITREGIYYKDSTESEIFLPADTVILAAGRRPRRAEMSALLNAAPRVYEVGDVIAQKDIMTATYLGYHAALDV